MGKLYQNVFLQPTRTPAEKLESWRIRKRYEERRQYTRYQANIPAKIDPGCGSVLQECVLTNISQGGARITIEAPEKLPDQFVVVLAPSVHRDCKIIWRSDSQVGIEFVELLDMNEVNCDLAGQEQLPGGIDARRRIADDHK
jgi:hypothetical protein